MSGFDVLELGLLLLGSFYLFLAPTFRGAGFFFGGFCFIAGAISIRLNNPFYMLLVVAGLAAVTAFKVCRKLVKRVVKTE